MASARAASNSAAAQQAMKPASAVASAAGTNGEFESQSSTTQFSTDQLQLLLQLLPIGGGRANDGLAQENIEDEGRLVIAEEDEEEGENGQDGPRPSAEEKGKSDRQNNGGMSSEQHQQRAGPSSSAVDSSSSPSRSPSNGLNKLATGATTRRKLNQPKRRDQQRRQNQQENRERERSSPPPAPFALDFLASPPGITIPPAQQQQLAELFATGLQHLLSLGASASNSSLPNPLATVSLEELGKMVLAQMFREIYEPAQQILAGLAEAAPSATADELINGAALAMAAQLGLMGVGPGGGEEGGGQGPAAAADLYAQFWQAIQMGLAQAVAAANMDEDNNRRTSGDNSKDDSGIVADQQLELSLPPNDHLFGSFSPILQPQSSGNNANTRTAHQHPNVVEMDNKWAAQCCGSGITDGGKSVGMDGQQPQPQQQWQQALADCCLAAMAANNHNGDEANEGNGGGRGTAETEVTMELMAALLLQQQQQPLDSHQKEEQQQQMMANPPPTKTSAPMQATPLNGSHFLPTASLSLGEPAISNLPPSVPSSVLLPPVTSTGATASSGVHSSAPTASSPSTSSSSVAGGGTAGSPKQQRPARQRGTARAAKANLQHQSSLPNDADFGGPLLFSEQLQQQQQHLPPPQWELLCQQMVLQQQQQQQGIAPIQLPITANLLLDNSGEWQQQQMAAAMQMLLSQLLTQNNNNNNNSLSQQQQIPAEVLALLTGVEQQHQPPAVCNPHLLSNSNLCAIDPQIAAAFLIAGHQQQNIARTSSASPSSFHQMKMEFKEEEKEDEMNGREDQQTQQMLGQQQQHCQRDTENQNYNGNLLLEQLKASSVPVALLLKREGQQKLELMDEDGDCAQQMTMGGHRRKKPREGRPRSGSQSQQSVVPAPATLTAKNEKSLGALLRQQHSVDGIATGGGRAVELEELEEFANFFKKQRIKHGFTQGDVGVALGKRYGTDFSQTTISRFEALNLSFKNMCKLRPLLQDWLEETERLLSAGASVQDVMEGIALQRVMVGHGQQQQQHQAQQSHQNEPVDVRDKQHKDDGSGSPTPPRMLPPFKKRRKRTNLDSAQKLSLNMFFQMDPRPDNTRMNEIASTLDLEQDVVRVWFCNRRQKLRKI